MSAGTRHRALVVLVVGSVAGGAAIVFGLPLNLFAPLAVLLVLLLPGLIVLAFLNSSFGRIEKAVLTLGISLGLTSIGGQLLNLTPLGLSAWSWLLWTAFLAAGALLLWRFRRLGAPAAQFRITPINIRRSALSRIAWFAPALTLLIVAVIVSRTPGGQQAGFTELWMVPSADGHSIQLGISSAELAETEYSLELRTGTSIEHEWSSIVLEPHKKWTTVVDLPADGAHDRIDAWLFLSHTPDRVYRSVTLSPAPTALGHGGDL